MVVFCGSGFSGRFAIVMKYNIIKYRQYHFFAMRSITLRSILRFSCTDLPSNDIMNRGYAGKDGLSFLHSAPA